MFLPNIIQIYNGHNYTCGGPESISWKQHVVFGFNSKVSKFAEMREIVISCERQNCHYLFRVFFFTFYIDNIDKSFSRCLTHTSSACSCLAAWMKTQPPSYHTCTCLAMAECTMLSRSELSAPVTLTSTLFPSIFRTAQ